MTYIAKSGDTLEGLYGTDWKNLSGYTGDPTKLQVGTQLPDLPKTQTDTSIASNITQTPTLQIPSGSPTTQDISPIKAYTDALNARITADAQAQKDAQAAKDAYATSDAAKTEQTFLQKITGATPISTVKSNALATTGFNETNYFAEEKAGIAELDALNKDYNSAIAARDTRIAQIQSNPNMSVDLQNSNVNLETRKAAIELNLKAANINSKAALLSAKQGQFQEAENFVQKAVDAATADLKFNYDQFMTFHTINQDAISKLDTKYQKALDDSLMATKELYDNAKVDKTEVGKLMIDPALAGAGISINDTLEQAQAKVAKYQQTPAYYSALQKIAQAKNVSSDPYSPLNLLRMAQYNALTKTASGQIVNASTGNAVKLTDTQSQFFSQGQALLTTAGEVQTLINELGTDAIKGWVTENGYLVPVVQNSLDPKAQELMQKLYTMNNLFVYFSSGKQINESEFERLSKQLPSLKATPDFNASAITNFVNTINGRMSTYLQRNGWTISGGGTTDTNQNQYTKSLDELYNQQAPPPATPTTTSSGGYWSNALNSIMDLFK